MKVLWRQIGMVLASLVGAVALLVFSSLAWGEPAGSVIDEGPAGSPYVSGELIVAFKTGMPDSGGKNLAEKAGANLQDSFPVLDAALLSFPKVENEQSRDARERTLEKIKNDLEKNPNVEAADYNYVRQPSFVPNDPKFTDQYGLKKPGFPQAWDTVRGNGVKVGVVDTGISARHGDLRGKVAAQKDFVNGDGKANDDVGHGTHVSGIIAANTDNGRGVAGGCPGCQLVVAKSLDAEGGTDAKISRGILWTVRRGAKVVNLSLGGPGRSLILERAVNRAWRHGAIVVSAAGNEDTSTPSYPAAYSRAMAVAATTPTDHRAGFSNFGDWVDIAAPGAHIISTYPGGKYRYFSGTSMASPEVAALAGLLADEGLSNGKIRDRLQGTAKDLGKNGRDPYYGAGRIDADKAVR